MGLSVKPKGIQLSYREGKPMKYKAQLMRYPTIKSDDLIKYAANASNVPVANIESCMQGLIEAIAYFVINGHRVVLPNVGGFFLGVQSKAATVADELEVKKALKTVRVLFAPATLLRDEMSENTINMLNASVGVEGGSTPTPSPTPVEVATPTFTRTQGGDGFSNNVTIHCATDGAVIHYTTDGSTPTKSSTTYTGEFSCGPSDTVKAIAYVGNSASEVAISTSTTQSGNGGGNSGGGDNGGSGGFDTGS